MVAMVERDLTVGVTNLTAMVVLVASLGGGWLGGGPGLLGVLTGGALALVSFRSLAARVRATAGTASTGSWVGLAVLRFAAVSAVAALLFVAGWAHPVGWLAGYSVLPVVLVVQGLRGAREESNSWT
jgi:ATP synthase I chain